VRLAIEQGPLAGQIISLPGQTFVVGRGEGCDLRLPEKGVSRQHARFQSGPQGWMVVDLGSTNGTYVNSQRLSPDQPYRLGPGDRITIEGSVLVVELIEPEDIDQTGRRPPETAGRRPRPVLVAAGVVVLVVVLVAMVILLVTLLQPESESGLPTVAEPLDQLATAFPVPTEVQGVMTAVVTVLPPGLPFLPLEPEPTPTPQAALTDPRLSRVPTPNPTPPALSGLCLGIDREDALPGDDWVHHLAAVSKQTMRLPGR
jgi:hypothetical protein